MARTATPLEIRLWQKINKRGPDECWPWTASTNRYAKTRGQGYGKISTGGRHRRIVSAHRLVYELEVGPIPDGMHVDHMCGNSLCCNPRHLQAVTPWFNNARSASPTADNIGKTHCPQGHEYTPKNTGYRKGKGYRYCRTCARLAQRAQRLGIAYPEWRASVSS